MNIEFTHRVIPTDTGGLMFQALVDGKSMVCNISAEALQQHFGGTKDVSDVQISNVEAFERGYSKITAAAERKLRAGEEYIMVTPQDLA